MSGWDNFIAFFSVDSPAYYISLLKQIPLNMLDYLVRLTPYVVLGSMLGEFLKFTSWTKILYVWMNKSNFFALPIAVVLGIISPLCTFGTVPVMIALYSAGIGAPPLIAFLSASSMMNPQLFIMTLGGLGADIALINLLSVFVFGLVIVLIAYALPESFIMRDRLRDGRDGREAILSRKKERFTLKRYLWDVVRCLRHVGVAMLIGIAIASVADVLPLKLFFAGSDSGGVLGIALSALAGIPLYACGGGVIPALASLLGQGMSRGAALAFLTVGPATRITSFAALSSVLKVRFILLYTGAVLAFFIGAGVFYS
ncbi:MAG: permease [Eubacteriales bacterium]